MRLPLLIILFLIVLALIDDLSIWIIARNFIHRHSKKRKWTIFWWIFSGCYYLLLAVALLIPRREENVDIQPIMWMLYTFLTIYAAKTIALLCGLIGFIPKLFGRKSLNLMKWVGLPVSILVFITFWWGALVTRKNIQVKQVHIVSQHIPESFDGYKIVQISDLHVGTWGNDTLFVSNLVDTVLAQKPDLIVFTGDVVNRHTLELRPFLKTLSRLNAPDGVLSVLGNHDYGDYITWERPSDRTENNALLAAWERAMGWRLLNNEHIWLTRNKEDRDSIMYIDSIAVIGVENWGEPPFRQYGRLENAYPTDPSSNYNVNDSRFKILLSHNPEHWRQVISKTTNIDLTLSGHTHAMQFVIKLGKLEWSPAKFKYEQWGGLYEKLNNNGEVTKVYVNIGSGEVGLPFRIGATPEVTVLTFYHTDYSPK